MPTVRYTVAQGEVIAEKRGGTRSLFTPDPLGSTIALIDNTQTITDTWVYWPYGEVKTRTGTTVTPFQYVGTQGYYHDSDGRAYVRARYLDKAKARWLTEDEFGAEPQYSSLFDYADNNPVTNFDPSGRVTVFGIIAGYIIGCAVCLFQKGEWVLEHPPSDIVGDRWEAYRHCLWSCLAMKACPPGCAYAIDLREGCDADSTRDLCNNRIGRRLAGSPSTCAAACRSALDRGDLIVGLNDPRCPPPRMRPPYSVSPSGSIIYH